MKESSRRIVLFAVIVVTGSVMILFDIPLLIMIPLVIVVGFIILFALGAVTIEDIRTSVAQIRRRGKGPAAGTPAKPVPAKQSAPTPVKIGFFEKIKLFKLPFRKSTGGAPPSPAGKTEKKPSVSKEAAKGATKSGGIGSHFSSFFSSLSSLGSVLKARRKPPRKVGEINKQLDSTINEKIPAEKPIPPSAPATSGGAVGGAAAVSAPAADADPFLSLSDDEFDAGLLDGLDEHDSALMQTPAAAPVSDEAANDQSLPDPSSELDAATAEILKSQGVEPGNLDEFSGLDAESGGELDAEFGDLDNISLDDMDVDLDEGSGIPDATSPAAVEAPSDAPAAAPAASPPGGGDSGAVKTAWIPSDAPKEQVDDQVSTHADMAAFAGGTTSDEDMLSSLASDVKTVKKEANLSLLRELKDFKAPASEIEKELDDVFQRIATVKSTQVKKPDTSLDKGMK